MSGVGGRESKREGKTLVQSALQVSSKRRRIY